MKKSLHHSLCFFLLLLSSTTFGQVTLLSNNTDITQGIVLNGKGLLLSDSDSIWTTTGTVGGTVKLTTAVSYVDTAGGALFAGKLFFAGSNTANGAELWATDATAAGTTLIKDINPSAANSVPANFIVYNNALYFTANNGTQGIELWTSNGTTAGTLMLKDINPGAGSSFTFANEPYFTINNGLLYFLANDGTTGTELWSTNGSSAGTVLVKDITPGAGGTAISSLTGLGNTLIIGLNSGGTVLSPFQLWKSDGTAVGTTLVKDFGTLSGLFVPSFIPFNNKLYFNGTDYANSGNELWVTDGTTAGTVLVKDINPGVNSSTPFLAFAVTINNKLYFSATNDATGNELWVSDGTSAGTQLLKDINPGASGSNPILFKNFDAFGYSDVTLYNGKVFFRANDGTHGAELWSTDGTSAGTSIVKDIVIGPVGALENSFSYIYTASGVFFSADDGTSGIEPWLSNGTAAGTTRIADVNPGLEGSSPQAVMFFNNQLYFNATNGDDPNHTDLYKVDAPLLPLPISLLNFSATVQSTNAVKLSWTTATEINSSHFLIERSIDGIHFAGIARLDSKGNTNVSEIYSLTDEDAGNLNSSVIYYRLKMVDKDGRYQYSQVLQLHLKVSSMQLTFTPNPVKDQLIIMVTPGSATQVALRITDASGKQVYNQNVAAGPGVYQQYINAAGWQKGVYYIQLITDGIKKSGKFIKQ